MYRRTELKTPVYKAPFSTWSTPKSKPIIHFLPNRKILISEFKELRSLKFGLTSAGWALMKDKNQSYFENETCPVCYCDADEDFPFKLPCCGNKIHAECFLHHVQSGTKNIATGAKARKYESAHLKCCFCRDMYTEKKDDFRYKREVYEACRTVNPDYWRAILAPAFDLHRDVTNLIKQKERGLPEEERGGWAIYNCDKCEKMYIPGKLSCAEELNLDLENQELVCPECEWALGSEDHRCFEHGKKFAIFKCDSCCSIASWDCYSNHYCEPCHQVASSVKFHPCPGRGKCPLGMPHPPNCEGVHGRNNFGFVIGCYKCQDDSYQPEIYNQNSPDPFLIEEQKGRNFEAMFNYKSRQEVEKARIELEKPRQNAKLIPIVQPIPFQGDAYDHFLAGFQSESESESESDEVLAAFGYDHFIAGFNQMESESESEESIAYEHFLEGFEYEEESESESEELGLAYMHFVAGFGDENEGSDYEIIEAYENFNAGFGVESEEESDSEETESLSSDIESEGMQSDVERELNFSVPAPRKKFSFPELMFAGQCSFEIELHEPSFEAPKMAVMESW